MQGRIPARATRFHTARSQRLKALSRRRLSNPPRTPSLPRDSADQRHVAAKGIDVGESA